MNWNIEKLWYNITNLPYKIGSKYRSIRYIIKWYNWERFKFLLYSLYIGGFNSGHCYEPRKDYHPIKYKLFKIWQFFFEKKVEYNGEFGKGSYYEKNNNPFRQKVPIRFMLCSVGWDNLIMNLCKDLVKAGWNKEICQVKSKFAGLRFYTNGLTEQQGLLISAAENASYKICETCGHDGKTVGSYWLYTTCEKHCTKEDLEEFYNTKENESDL